MKFLWFFFASAAATSHAQVVPDENNTVASSPFQLYLDPTFVQLNLESQAIASNIISEILSSAASNELHHVSVVIQDVSFEPHGRRHLRPNQKTQLELPSTTLSFAVLANISGSTLTRDYLNQLVRNVLTSNAGQAELLSQLKSHHAHFKDLRLVQVTPVVSTLPTPTATDNSTGFIQQLTFVDIVLLLVSIVVLIGVSVIIVASIRSSRRDHEGVLQMLQRERQHMAAALYENQEESSISSRLYLLKSSMQNKGKMDITNLHVAESIDETPEATEDEEEVTDNEQEPVSSGEQQPVSLEAHMVGMERTSDSAADHPSAAEPTQNSPLSFHSAKELLAPSSSAEQSESSNSSSMRSGGVIADFDVIMTPASQDEEFESDAETSGRSGHSSGMSSAHFSTSRFFHSRTNGMSTAPSEDTFDVFAVDVHKYEASILELGHNDDNGSKTSATSSFLEEWVKQIRVIPMERSSAVMTDDGASIPECASVPSVCDLSYEEALKVLDQATTHLEAPASVVEENNQ